VGRGTPHTVSWAYQEWPAEAPHRLPPPRVSYLVMPQTAGQPVETVLKPQETGLASDYG
jgi:hypothetical protein